MLPRFANGRLVTNTKICRQEGVTARSFFFMRLLYPLFTQIFAFYSIQTLLLIYVSRIKAIFLEQN